MLRALFGQKRRHLSKSFQQMAAEVCEARELLSSSFGTPQLPESPASIDGTGNNLLNPDWGSTNEELLRLTTAEYTDGVSSPAGADRPSARVISNEIAAQTESIVNDRYLTDYIWVWGQFLDHDIDLTGGADPAEAFPIDVPTGDQFFDPFSTGTATIDLSRSVYVEGADSSDGLRQQLNQITAFIDGSVVYGSDDIRAAELRTFEGGHLKTSDGDLLPFNTAGLDNAGGTSDTLFLAGDVRANENVLLSSMQTLWVREHNRIADELAARDPSLTDEQLYQGARRVVIAEIQAITYNEFLPALLGSNAPGDYEGYDPNVDPGIANIFSTAAYRLGHSLLSPELQRIGADGSVIDEGNLALQSAFFNPSEVVDHGIDSLLRGAATQLAQELDNQVIDDVRNFLFGPPGAGGFDLASLNIQRGRDHGLADYNQARIDMGLAPVTSFSEISSDPEVAAKLESLYGSVDNIDAWVGGLAEDHLPGSSVGELFTAVLADQFERLRAGDRYWYQNTFSGEELRRIDGTTLKDVIERNTDITGLQDNVFFGKEVFYVDLARLPARDVTVTEAHNRVYVLDRATNQLLAHQSLGGLERVVVMGDAHRNEMITFGVKGHLSKLTGGIAFYGNQGNQDQLRVWGTDEADTISMDASSLHANSAFVEYFGIRNAMIVARGGNDVVELNNSLADQVAVYGGNGDDVLIGGRLDDYLNGGHGNDTLMGLLGNDRLVGGPGRDVLIGGDGHDALFGDDGDDVLLGQAGNDWLYGGTGNNVLIGGAGIDMIDRRRERTEFEILS
ncbi:MAG: peroxidase [Planctomycetaceae bacterium]|nr:peroxidase [Planctomycetaceae bacterium]